ncbi:MAG: MATE family efflux transporter, partial [Clostridia bacterium]|nr:MATE family efflux transporter [Clostridia bacterium]
MGAAKMRTEEITKQEAGDAKYIRMTTEPVEKLITKLAVPTIISMLVTTFYNLADTLFVRQLENDSMVAAVGVVLPLMNIIQAFGFFCGHGSGNYISRAFGRRDYKDAETMAATGFGYAFLFGVLFAAIGLIFREPLAMLLGAKTQATIASTIDYMIYILIATPFMTGAIVMNNQLRMQGNAFFAMIGLTSGAIVNLVLDPLLIFSKGDTLFSGAITMPCGAGMGVAGAALATAVSQVVSFVLLAVGMGKSDNIQIRLRNFSPKFFYLRGIVQGGLPSLARQGLASVATACLNHSIGLYLVTDEMIDAVQAAMTGTSKIMMFLSSALIGFGQGFQPVCGFNYGAKKYDRVRRAYCFCVRVSAVALVVLAALGYVFAEPITHAVAGSSPLAAEIAAFTFRAQLVVFPLMSWVTLCNMMLQNIGMTMRAT